MAKLSRAQIEQMAEELLCIKSIHDRYEQLEKQLKAALVTAKLPEIDNPRYGRVFVSTSQVVTVSPALAREVLGADLAGKVIKVSESVPNEILKALVATGDITAEQREQLMDRADKADRVSLYVRPLQ